MLAPICLFTYNRLSETQQTVAALQRNYLAAESELFVFSDGPKNEDGKIKVEVVREYIHSISGFKSVEIFESPLNKGLANSIIDGVSQIIEKYGKVIVLEDDLISTSNFLIFMNKALDFYIDEKNIQSVNGYSLSLKDKKEDVYFQIRPFPWGWATWKDSWDPQIFNKEDLKREIESNESILKQFNKVCGNDISKMLLDSINNKNDSWYVRWTFDHFRNNKYSVYPSYSFIQNIGHNDLGTHCKGINSYRAILVDNKKIVYNFIRFHLPNKRLSNEFLNYFSIRYKLFFRIKLLTSKVGRKNLIKEIVDRMS